MRVLFKKIAFQFIGSDLNLFIIHLQYFTMSRERLVAEIIIDIRNTWVGKSILISV